MRFPGQCAWKPQPQLPPAQFAKLKLCAFAACVSTITDQCRQVLGIFAKGRTVVRSRRCQTLTRHMRTLLAFRHFVSPRTTLFTVCDAPPTQPVVPCHQLTTNIGIRPQRAPASMLSAWRKLVSVRMAPLSILAISLTRSSSVICRIAVCVRPLASLFSMRKC